ncbi:MAG: oligosaccharide flippase family protein [Anaerolineae bacterium]
MTLSTLTAAVSRRLAFNSLWLLLARAAGQGLMVVFTALVARYLGERGLGQYAFLAAIVYVGNVFTTFGMDTLLIREIAVRRRADTPLLTAALLIELSLSLLFIAAIFFTAQWMPNLSDNTRISLKFYTLSLIPLAFYTLYSAALRAYERVDLTLWLTLFTAIVQTAGAFLLLRNGGGLRQLVWLLLTVNAAGAALAGWVCARTLPNFAYNWRVNSALLRQTLRAGGMLAVLMVTAVIYQRLGVFSLSLLGNDAMTGWFSAAARIVEALKMLPYAVFGALFPVMARRERQPAQAAAKASSRFEQQALVGLSAYAITAALGLAWTGESLIRFLYGRSYDPSVRVLSILGLSLIPFLFSLTWSFRLVAAGRERLALQAMLVTIVIAGALFTFLAPRWGALGAAWAAVIAEVIQAIILHLSMRRDRSSVDHR